MSQRTGLACPKCSGVFDAKALGKLPKYCPGCRKRGKGSPRPALIRACDQCGVEFHPRANQLRCSPECRREWRIANKHSRSLDRNAPSVRAIHERDNWTCGICELPIDPTTPFPEPGAPTIDHIIPVSLGGTHDETNLRSAHFYCNTVRGNRQEVA